MKSSLLFGIALIIGSNAFASESGESRCYIGKIDGSEQTAGFTIVRLDSDPSAKKIHLQRIDNNLVGMNAFDFDISKGDQKFAVIASYPTMATIQDGSKHFRPVANLSSSVYGPFLSPLSIHLEYQDSGTSISEDYSFEHDGSLSVAENGQSGRKSKLTPVDASICPTLVNGLIAPIWQ